MDKETAAQLFAEADTLFREGAYAEALDVLNRLNLEFANRKNILYPAAKCMEKLGRIEEAKALCHQLIRLFDYQKARELLNHLEVAPRVAAPVMAEEEATTKPWAETPPRRSYPVASDDEDNRWFKLGMVIAANVASFVLLHVFVYLPSQHSVPGEGSILPAVFSVIAAILLFHFSWCYVFKRICENADTEPGILIWIPLLAIIPVMRAARMGFLWLLTLLAPVFLFGVMIMVARSTGAMDLSNVSIQGALFAFSVLVNLLLFALFCVVSFFFVLYIKLAEECGKPAWLGVLLLWQPWGAMILPCYLAFSQSDSQRGFQPVGDGQ